MLVQGRQKHVLLFLKKKKAEAVCFSRILFRLKPFIQ